MNIQIFGTKKCNDTKKAERFFKERGIKFQFIDMKEKGMSKGEFNSVAQANGGLENISNTAVTQIELFRAFKVFLTSDVVSLNIIKYKSIAQILNVLADGYMIGWSLICCQ